MAEVVVFALAWLAIGCAVGYWGVGGRAVSPKDRRWRRPAPLATAPYEPLSQEGAIVVHRHVIGDLSHSDAEIIERALARRREAPR